MKSVTFAAALLVAVPAFAEDKAEVRLLKDAKPLPSRAPGQPKAVEITSADELAKSPAFDAATRDVIKKAVNFDKEKVVAFAWGGSGQDKLIPALKTVDDKRAAVFTYMPGAIDDFRMHSLAFVVPKDAKVEVRK